MLSDAKNGLTVAIYYFYIAMLYIIRLMFNFYALNM